MSFNPLHCGAVVASARARAEAEAHAEVSIPFIAGQWSLPARRKAGGARRTRFNPLHCGAVVASRGLLATRCNYIDVSIPFIAGQWSLPAWRAEERASKEAAFQSPSLRGSGRFAISPPAPQVLRGVFQSPSLRGSGRFWGLTGYRLF